MNAAPFYRRSIRFSRFIFVCMLGLGCLSLTVSLAAAAPTTLPGQSDSEDLIAPLAPVKVRSETEQDHLDALAHFATGRMAQQREDNAAALKHYTRAYRLDPAATHLLREIVPLAFTLDRSNMAVRYAILAVEHEPTDSQLLRRLAAFLTDGGNEEKALLLYEKAAELSAAKKEPATPTTVVTAMEMGRLYYLAKKYPQAADQFTLVLKALEKPTEFGLDEAMQKALVGSSDVTYQLFAEAFLDAGRFDQAAQAFTQANQVKPNAPQLALNMARVLYKRGEFDAALTSLEQFFSTSKTDEGVLPYELLADILKAQDKSETLLPRLEKLRTAKPDDVSLSFYVAEQLRQKHELEKAESIYQTLLSHKSSKSAAEVYQGLVEIYRQQAKYDALLKVLGKLVDKAGSLQPLGETSKSLTADTKFVEALLKDANHPKNLAANAKDFGTLLAAAHLALAIKKYDEANTWFARAMQAPGDKSTEFIVSWGLDLLLAEQYAAAADVLRKAIDEKRLIPNNPILHYYLSSALEMQGKTDEALAVAREAVAMQPKSPRYASRLAWILYHAKRTDEAQREYEKLLATFDNNFESDEAREVMREARLVLSNMAVQQNNLPVAEEWLEQLLDEFPEDIGALNDLGYLWADQSKRLARALIYLQKAVAAEPKNAAYRDSLGWVYFRLGEFDKAVIELKQAVALEENPDGVLFDHLGDALQKSGDLPAAKDAWQKSITTFEKASEATKADAVKQKLTPKN